MKFKTDKEFQKRLEEGLELEVGDRVELERFESEKDGSGVIYEVVKDPNDDNN